MLLALTSCTLQSTSQTANPPAIGFARESYVSEPLKLESPSKFKVSFANTSSKGLVLMTEACSWGYEMLGFEAIDPAGHNYSITRIPRPWYRNVPTPFTIAPGEVYVRAIDFGDKTWRGFPAGVAGSGQGWKVRVTLRIENAPYITETGCWTGQATSPWIVAQP